MFKHLAAAFVCLSGLVYNAAGAELTPMETRWLQAAAPVLAYARQQALPIDIIVQPQAGPNDVPMAMGFEGSRCKLVLSLRGNPEAEDILAGLDTGQRSLMIEVMAAHEVAHCWRYAHGVWHALPAGFVDVDGDLAGAQDRQAEQVRAMREMRREEGYSDLVALAWTARQHRADYGAVLSWLGTVRSSKPMAGGGHDTMAWVVLARDPAAFKAGVSPFEAVDPLWSAGLLKIN